ncbi:glycosyltransferase family 4 protein [Massilia aurea]|uniref:glycosyltransferase family 4 protein n=1 Tax=Massilia aurea TaxID=373040 RepID=UPI0034632510
MTTMLRARRCRVLMAGTAPGGRGGVASAVAALRAAGLFEREGVVFIATHVDGSGRVKLGCALRGVWQAAVLCMGRRPAIVHVHASSGASFVRKSLVLALGRLTGARTVFHLHGGAFDRFATGRASPLLQRWIRHTLEASSCVIALSPGWAVFVRAFAPLARVEVVPNAVPVPVPMPDMAWTGAGAAPRILFLGRVHPAKGVGELLDACALLAPRYPQLRLVLAGEGELDWARRRAAARGIGGQVDLPGWLDAAACTRQLACASVFCLPSWAEGVPMAMLEAMAAGRPVVVSAVGGMLDVIRDGVDGVLVPPRDAMALAAGLERVLCDPAFGASLAQGARARIEMDYSMDQMCRRLAAIYARLAANR